MIHGASSLRENTQPHLHEACKGKADRTVSDGVYRYCRTRPVQDGAPVICLIDGFVMCHASAYWRARSECTVLELHRRLLQYSYFFPFWSLTREAQNSKVLLVDRSVSQVSLSVAAFGGSVLYRECILFLHLCIAGVLGYDDPLPLPPSIGLI